MEAKAERRERGDGPRSRGMSGMSSGGSTEDDAPPGPWGHFMGEGDPIWGEDGDDETLLLQKSRLPVMTRLSLDPGKLSLNPFDTELWLPLQGLLILQERMQTEPLRDVTLLSREINSSLNVGLKMSPGLFEQKLEANSEPSHLSIN